MPYFWIMPGNKTITEKQLPFLQRPWIYQRERFPLAGHGLLVTAFSFSAMVYARICRATKDIFSKIEYNLLPKLVAGLHP